MAETGVAMDAAVVTALEVAGVPPRYVDRRFATFLDRRGTAKALEAARRLAAEDAPAGGLVLVGPPGTGKTHLAAAILAARAERWIEAYPEELHVLEELVTFDAAGAEHRTPLAVPEVLMRPPFRSRFASVPALLDELREAVRRPDTVDPLRPLMDAPLVVLDDLGREKATEWAVERLFVLVDRRYAELRPTIVTTNYGLDELAERGYDAMASRLVEGSAAVRLTASDYRVGVRP